MTLVVYFGRTVPGIERNPIRYGDEPRQMDVGSQFALHHRLANPVFGYLEDGFSERFHSHSFYVPYLYLGCFSKLFGSGLFQARMAAGDAIARGSAADHRVVPC